MRVGAFLARSVRLGRCGVAVRGVFLRTSPGSVGSGFSAGDSAGDTTLTKKPATVTRQHRGGIIKAGESVVNAMHAPQFVLVCHLAMFPIDALSGGVVWCVHG